MVNLYERFGVTPPNQKTESLKTLGLYDPNPYEGDIASAEVDDPVFQRTGELPPAPKPMNLYDRFGVKPPAPTGIASVSPAPKTQKDTEQDAYAEAGGGWQTSLERGLRGVGQSVRSALLPETEYTGRERFDGGRSIYDDTEYVEKAKAAKTSGITSILAEQEKIARLPQNPDLAYAAREGQRVESLYDEENPAELLGSEWLGDAATGLAAFGGVSSDSLANPG